METLQQVPPTLLKSLQTHMEISLPNSASAQPLTELSTQKTWAKDTAAALALAEQSPRNNDKALNQLTTAMAQYAMDRQGIVYDPRREKMYKQVYTKVNQAAKKAYETEGLTTDPAFAQAVYLEILPVLLTINDVSDTSRNERGYNSIDQIVATTMTFMRAPHVRDTGGTFTIFQQMCAQYDSGSSHDQSSFSRGLLKEVNPHKVKKVLEPVKEVAKVLRRFDVPVEIVHAQVAPHGELLLAMVPATVWSYVDKPGGAAEMVHILGTQNRDYPQVAKAALEVNGHQDYRHHAPSYTEIKVDEERSISQETLRVCEMFGQIYQAFQARERPSEELKNWSNLSPEDVKNTLDFIDYNYSASGNFHEVAEENNWTKADRTMMELVMRTLAMPDWGTLADTVKFYGRENQRRSSTTAESWKRTLDKETEIRTLLASPHFHAELNSHERQLRAEHILHWIDAIANIGIGSRAVYNTALYATLGKHIVNLNHGKNAGVMWPLEEDSDRWGQHIMDAVWQKFSPVKDLPHFPYVMPEKSLRQPLM